MADNLDEQQIKNIAEAFRSLSNEVNPLTEKSKLLAEQAEKNSKAFKLFGKEMTDAGASLRKAALNVSDTTGKYAEGVESATSAVSNLASNFGVLGKGIGFLVNIFGKLAGGALKQNEQLVKSYRSLSQIGDLGESFDALKKNMHDAGYSVDQNSEEYVKSIQKVAPSLALFSGTVIEGKKRLDSVFQDTLGDAEYELKRFGYTTEEAFERTGFYMSQLASSGGQRNKTDKEINKQSITYLETLASLSMITGQTRDEAENKLRKDQNDLRFQMHLSKLEQSESQEDRNAAENLRLVMAVLPEDLAEGAKSVIVNQGRIVDDFGAKIYQAIGNEGIAGIIQTVRGSTEKLPENMATMMNKHSVLLNKRFTTFAPAIGIANDAATDFGLNINSRNYMLQGEMMSAKKTAEMIDRIKNKQAKNDMDNITKRGKSERMVRNAFEELEYEISKIMIPALDSFADALISIGGAFADILYTITAHKVDLRDSFVQIKSLGDVSKTLATQNKKEEDLQKRLIDLKETDAKNEKFIIEQQERKKRGESVNAFALEKGYQYRKEHQEKIGEVEANIAKSRSVSDRARSSGSRMMQSAPSETTQGTGDLAGLTIKKGDVHREGSALDPSLVKLAHKIKDMEGFAYFSSFNDQYHKDSSGQHSKGKAVDFALNYWPTPEQGKKIQEVLKGLGASTVLDEYNNPTSNATGGHIHAELQGKTQGIFKGPESGYWLKAHGEEALVNQNGLANMVTKMQMPNMGGGSSDLARVFQDGISQLISEMSDLVELQRVSNRTQDELLTYTKN
jgi:hypothetical protein